MSLGHHPVLLSILTESEISKGAAGTLSSTPTWDASITNDDLTHWATLKVPKFYFVNYIISHECFYLHENNIVLSSISKY